MSENGLMVLKHFEGCELKAYPDPGSGGAPWTIGYGCTGPDICEGLVWTQPEAEMNLLGAIAERERDISINLRGLIASQGQFDALVDFLFNKGPGRKGVKDGLFTLKSGEPSTLWRKVLIGDFEGAAGQFGLWTKASGQTMRGLVRRAAAERALFEGATGAEAIRIGERAA